MPYRLGPTLPPLTIVSSEDATMWQALHFAKTFSPLLGFPVACPSANSGDAKNERPRLSAIRGCIFVLSDKDVYNVNNSTHYLVLKQIGS